MRAFVSYRFGDDITAIKELLMEKDIDIFDSMFDIKTGESFQQSIKDAIKSCDFLIFNYSEDNLYIAFEAGVAVAVNKPIFSILNGGHENTFLLDSTYVHAHPNEVEKIRFSFELFLKNTIFKKKKNPLVMVRSSHYYGGGEAIPNKSHFNVVERYNGIKDKSDIALERFFEEIFLAYSVNAVKNSNINSQTSGWLPDFSIWSDLLAPILGNPIIVEIKPEINNRNLDELANTIIKLVTTNPTSSVLILYDSLRNITRKDLPITPSHLFIAIPELIEELDSHGFASSIRKFRNNLVHSI
ncbi:toll/interleukin-1 receptor domain-containing protein [Dyadobacter subterraneus]|uniref:Toll/interleukin-1 receptor domain-containing protein n=1 Tax=Dyadobacter subterraneus TaxID=2773304 RepID=A0ABR9W9T9_9BACT|nr:toll/interleukin-1 receptor domain-containing protein [Dyadobacter subterraneus]MBE9461904.1 toll/interleukin-1 receptor domain-containing protein [Dyadobacter subterraneus]